MPTVTFPRRPLVSYPILSFFYKLFYTSSIFARLPLWAISFSLFKGTRPLPTWSFKQSLLLRGFFEYLAMLSRAETPVPLPLEPGKEKDRWQILEPFPMPRGTSTTGLNENVAQEGLSAAGLVKSPVWLQKHHQLPLT
ncbi:hypothetical protein NUW58_g9392 [Xylaria curta]|uniref:Uncharacterized protein n=1 Tax=Xylaria curta TaxID=42375 RepID=A0ACC1MXG4_9PEZI|nr:hypothetical protein NUW58_g9392 [Xylaria curta]